MKAATPSQSETPAADESKADGAKSAGLDSSAALAKAQWRLSVLQLAEKLKAERQGGVSEACRLSGMTRTQFYGYRKRYEQFGLEGLQDRPPLHKPNAQLVQQREAVARQIIELALKYPEVGCTTLESYGAPVSFVTIRKILKKAGLGTRAERTAILEKRWRKQPQSLSLHQLAFLGKHDPQLIESNLASRGPAELLYQFDFLVRFPHGSIRIYAVLDPFGSLAWASAHSLQKRAGERGTQYGLLLLKNQVWPFYTRHNLKIGAVETIESSEYCYSEFLSPWKRDKLGAHPYSNFLHHNSVRHRHPRPSHANPHGTALSNAYARSFDRVLRVEFLVPLLRQNPDLDLATFQLRLRDFLSFYNEERPHFGYPNNGQPPAKFFAAHMEQRSAKG